MKGTIKKLVKEKLFGFILDESTGKDVFFHGNNLVGADFNDLNEGDSVTFEIETTNIRGEEKTGAVNVQRA
ncbi:MAG: cold shock domain-containing protein [Candidatus Pacebacteria bacterium]|jgi:CspA family cold shock protein|nr:cold shock domain-containing protein [Candidatus Paceibacterota bacterium]